MNINKEFLVRARATGFYYNLVHNNFHCKTTTATYGSLEPNVAKDLRIPDVDAQIAPLPYSLRRKFYLVPKLQFSKVHKLNQSIFFQI